MRIAIVGAGAIGGHLGVRLAAAGDHVTFIARGANLDAIRRDGMRLIEEDGTETHVREVGATDSMREAGVHDVVLLTVKAHQVGPIAPDLAHLIGPQTAVVTLQNGIPWWYFLHGYKGAHAGAQVENSDPGGQIARHLDPAKMIGAVVYPAAMLVAPGVVQVVEGDRYTLGEPDGSISPRATALSERLVAAGFKAPVIEDIRSEIWLKLWGNLSFNPISALTHATLVDICQFPETRALARSMMEEAQSIANSLGVTFRVDIDRRIAGAEKVGAHKTSMLQDVEAGRAIELEALVGSVIELGRLTGTPTPHIGTVYALMRLLAKTLGDANGKLAVRKA